jgi:hypothetical protein
MEAAHNDLRHTRLVAHTGVVSRVIGNETLLVPVSSRVGDLDAIYTLSGIGPRIWTLLQRAVSSRQIVDVICEEYDVPAEIAAADVAEFLDALLAKKLVNPAPGNGD